MGSEQEDSSLFMQLLRQDENFLSPFDISSDIAHDISCKNASRISENYSNKIVQEVDEEYILRLPSLSSGPPSAEIEPEAKKISDGLARIN